MEDIHSLEQLLSKYDIVIPLIQRDYVQGADYHAQKRDAFIYKLMSCLKSGKKVELDFIYGVCDEKRRNQFMPLDGQQRLTTLFLLRWLMLHYIDAEDEFAKRNYFSYQIRRTSESFCKKMISGTFDLNGLDGDHAVSMYIQSKNWFVNEWKSDPTICAMLDMLDAIYKLLPKEKEQVAAMLGNLDKCIHFDMLDMKEYRLSDSLYVKMNERGKQLTDFENWKASFIRLIDLHYKDVGFDVSDNDRKQYETIAKYFEHSIEHQWTDMLWTYALNEWKMKKNEDEKKNKYPTIDNAFMNLFKFIHEVIFFNENPQIDGRDVQAKDFNNSLVQQDVTFSNKNNIVFLFTFLDAWSKISQTSGINTFFNELYTGLHLWGDISNPNLFIECIDNDTNFDVRHKILLFALTEYCIQNSCYSVTDELRLYIRVCRNLIESINQFSRASVSVNTNVRVSDWSKYINVIKTLSCKLNVFEAIYDCRQINGFGKIQHEIEKYEISGYGYIKKWEDYDMFKGNMSAVLPATKLHSLNEIDEAISAFNSATCTQKVQLLVAFGYKGLNVGWCMFGDRHFFGNDGRWDVIFSYDAPNVCAAFTDYINAYTVSHSVSELIKQNIDTNSNYNFKYYFLKYNAFAEVPVPWKRPCFYYAWSNQRALEIIGLTSFSQSPLLSYHSEPFAATVAAAFRDDKQIYSKLAYISRYSDRASLLIEDKNIKMSSCSDHWEITLANEFNPNCLTQIQDKLATGLTLFTNDDKKSWKLVSIQRKDLVEIGIEFVRCLFSC